MYARVFLRRLLALASAYPEMRLGEIVKLTPVLAELSDEWEMDLVGDGRVYEKVEMDEGL